MHCPLLDPVEITRIVDAPVRRVRVLHRVKALGIIQVVAKPQRLEFF